VVLLLFFPLRYPEQTVELDPQGDKPFLLHREQPLLIQVPAKTNVSHVSFWVVPKEPLPHTTALELRILGPSTNEEKRLKKISFGAAYDSLSHELGFKFWPLRSSEKGEWKIIVSAPDLAPDKAIALEPPFSEAGGVNPCFLSYKDYPSS